MIRRRVTRTPGTRVLLLLALAFGGSQVRGAPAWAQAGPVGSRLVAADHWAYEYVRRLHGAGYLTGLDLLRQPMTRREIALRIAVVNPDSLPEPATSWLRLLREEFAAELEPADGARAGLVLAAGATAANTRRLDPFRPLGEGSVWSRAGAGAWVETGAFAAETRVVADAYLKHDPDGRSPYLRMGARTDHTYLSFGGNTGNLFLGRVARNWAPPGLPGLLVSNNPLSYPQVGMDLRFGRAGFQAFTAQLDTLEGTRRFLAANRVAYLAPRLTIAVTEALLYATNSGLSLQLLNPFTALLFEHEAPPDENWSQNLMLGLQVWHGGGDWEVYGEGLLDDIDVNPDSGLRRAPARYAVMLGMKWRPRGPRVETNTEYRRVSAYAYRSYQMTSRYDYLSRGLGDHFADYDRLSVSVDVFPPLRGLRLTPAFDLLRQGEGDYRLAFPADSAFRRSSSLFLGIVERTYRIGLRGRYQPTRHFWLTWDAGHNVIRNAGHVPGASRSKLVVLVTAGARLEFGGTIGPRP